ncbi:MAG TPA: glycosyltransferase [Solirubrobacteraceae bacterium]
MPDISVCVPSHDRPLRLRWLLNALEEQTLDRDRFEVVVAHDSAGPETEELLTTHPLAKAGVLRHLTFAPGPGPAQKRNAAWRAARAPLVVFTDDDCRPPAEWLERALDAAHSHPGAIVQGATAVDPDEEVVRLHAPHARFQVVDPPVIWAQTCNIVYPRDVLEACGGFDEALPVAAGEDTDLALRARAAGTPYVGAPEVLTYHAVEPASLVVRAREVWRWQHLPYLARRHPQVREPMPLRIFWKRTHARLPLMLAGALLIARRRPLLGLLLALPWVAESLPAYGRSPRGILRALSELPGHALIDLVEFAALVRGSARHRSLLL